MPTHPARARSLLTKGRAVVANRVPFIIRLKDRNAADGMTVVRGVIVGIDPGSRQTGMAVFLESTSIRQTSQVTIRRGMFAVEVHFRGHLIHRKLRARAAWRRGRRSRNLRHREPRFKNRTKPQGWLPPSLRHRVDATTSMLAKLRAWFPVIAVHIEYGRFDPQALEHPMIKGIEYRHGDLFGYEARDYLIEKWGLRCAYCDAEGVRLTIDHIHPKARGGSNRASNLALACLPCNRAKGPLLIEAFVTDSERLARIRTYTRRSLSDAAAVNSTMKALVTALTSTGLPITSSSPGRTRINREISGLPKSHCIDALSVGQVDRIVNYPATIYVAAATGRGQYQRTKPNKFGFPRKPYRPFAKKKRPLGFATGDYCRATIPSGKRAGTYVGRIAIRTSGSFNITTTNGITIQGLRYRHFTLIQRNNGWRHSTRAEPTNPES
jgi:5-methylcytosine-specific restriction endonuclease McrA